MNQVEIVFNFKRFVLSTEAIMLLGISRNPTDIKVIEEWLLTEGFTKEEIEETKRECERLKRYAPRD